jgi:hypothetical protein
MQHFPEIDPDQPEHWGNEVFIVFYGTQDSIEIIEYVLNLITPFPCHILWVVDPETPEPVLALLQDHPQISLAFTTESLEKLSPEMTDMTRQTNILFSSEQPDKTVIQKLLAGQEKSCCLYDATRSPNQILKPEHSSGITYLPIGWSDQLACEHRSLNLEEAKKRIKRDGLKVFLFHPLHVFLNAADTDLIQQTLPLLGSDFRKLFNQSHPGFGARSLLMMILSRQALRQASQV